MKYTLSLFSLMMRQDDDKCEFKITNDKILFCVRCHEILFKNEIRFYIANQNSILCCESRSPRFIWN